MRAFSRDRLQKSQISYLIGFLVFSMQDSLPHRILNKRDSYVYFVESTFQSHEFSIGMDRRRLVWKARTSI